MCERTRRAGGSDQKWKEGADRAWRRQSSGKHAEFGTTFAGFRCNVQFKPLSHCMLRLNRHLAVSLEGLPRLRKGTPAAGIAICGRTVPSQATCTRLTAGEEGSEALEGVEEECRHRKQQDRSPGLHSLRVADRPGPVKRASLPQLSVQQRIKKQFEGLIALGAILRAHAE